YEWSFVNILLTGASSFTGSWFAQTLKSKGHDVWAPLHAAEGSYTGVRQERVARLESSGVILSWETPFGSDGFLNQIREGIDVICHHAAHVKNYKSSDFDIVWALQENTRNVNSIFAKAKKAGVRVIIHTGSIFEEGEGCGEAPLHAFSPYGLSKGLTHQILHFWSEHYGIPLSKFVIPNPFGPFEEPRFCAYLMQCWAKKR
ncbi:UDP-glucose 4-epimerase, partial [mine drainage metagenome]